MSDKIRYFLFVAYLLATLFLVFGGLILQDYANKPFWWNFWTYSPILGVGGFAYGIFGLSKTLLPKTGDKEKK
jgi:hypothetical protein